MSHEEGEILLADYKRLQDENIDLKAQLAWFRRHYFGRKSEKLAPFDPNQLALFESLLPREELQEIEAAKAAAEKEIEKKEETRKRERRNRDIIKDLPVVEVVIEPENIDLEKYRRIGDERTRTLEFEPGRLYVKEIVRPKYGLIDNTMPVEKGESGVVIAPLPLLPIYKGLPGASLLAEILLQKYEYHMPFYRQIQAFRHLGIKISESTLSGWFKPVCELLRPLYEELKGEVLKSDYIQVDETTLPVVNRQSHQAKKEYLWVVRSVMDRQVFFHYAEGSRSGETVSNLLQDYKGNLQSDGYSAYDQFERKDDVCLVACMAHIRRHFEQALDENKELASYGLKEIQNLYHIERMADEQELSFDKRRELRGKLARPIMDAFEIWMESTHSTVRPKSRMAEAIGYAYALWARMRNYLNDGRIKIDNNMAENALRRVAVGRKNYLFCGNHKAAENTAVIYSLLSSCKEVDVNPRDWLNDVLAKLPYCIESGNKEDLVPLLPARWKEENAKEL